MDTDRGLLGTLRDLAIRPAAVIHDWWAGRTARRTNPAKVFVLAMAVGQAAAMASGFLEGMASGLLEEAGGSDAARRRLVWLATHAPALLFGAGLPVYALWTRVLFRRAGRTYAEHLVFAFYTTAFVTVFFVAFLVVGYWGPGDFTWPLLLAWLVASVAYPVWVTLEAFGADGLRGGTRAVTAVVVAVLTFLVALIVLLGLV